MRNSLERTAIIANEVVSSNETFRREPAKHRDLHRLASDGDVHRRVGAIWLCSALLEAVLDNATLVRLDVAAAEWIHAHVTSTGTRFASDLGNWIANDMGVIAADWRSRAPATSYKTLLFTWIAAFVGGGMLEKVLKILVHRSRPIFNTSAPAEQSLSFPSGPLDDVPHRRGNARVCVDDPRPCRWNSTFDTHWVGDGVRAARGD